MMLGQPAERGEIEMIVMIVAEQDEVDGREIFEVDSGGAVTFWTRPGKGTGAKGPNRIREDVESAGLDENGGVIDDGDAQSGTVDAGRWNGGHDVGDEVWGTLGAAGEFPTDDAGQAERAAAIGVGEAFTVEVGQVISLMAGLSLAVPEDT